MVVLERSGEGIDFGRGWRKERRIRDLDRVVILEMISRDILSSDTPLPDTDKLGALGEIGFPPTRPPPIHTKPN